jgi:dolichol-phosphate mannosyltransferase
MTEATPPVASPPVQDARPLRSVIVVPTYDEAQNVEAFLDAVRRSVPNADVLVVDDNSPDGTGDLAERRAADLGQIKVLHRPGKLGLGSAYRHGFEVAIDEGYDLVVSMDVDFSHDPATIPALIAHIEDGADAVIGSRYVPGGGTERWPWQRRLLSRWGNRYTSFVLRLPIHDCTSGFRAYRTSALRAIDPASTAAEGYAFLTELVLRLVRGGYRVEEHPITFVDRRYGTSKMSARIIRESMLRVTGWGVRDASAAVRRKLGRP